MSQLQFCEQCEVHHQIEIYQGQTAFSQCERKVQQQLYNQSIPIEHSHLDSHRDVSFLPTQSYTSINAHVQRPRIAKSKTQVQISFKCPQDRPIKKLILNQKRVFYDSQNIQTNPKVQIKVLNPHNPRVQTKVGLKQQKVVRKGNFSNQFQNAILSTIKEERRQSEKSSTISHTTAYCEVGYSTRSLLKKQTQSPQPSKYCSQEKQKSKSPTYVFKNLKKRLEETNEAPNEQNCWCW